MVVLRDSSAVFVGDVTLPWGGEVDLRRDEMDKHGYQAVAQKGRILELHRHRIWIGGGVQSGAVQGMGAVPVGIVAYGFKFYGFELSAQLRLAQRDFAAVDTTIETLIVGGSLVLTYEYPLRWFDLRGSLIGRTEYWRQDVRKEGRRQTWFFAVGGSFGIRAPVYRAVFAELAAEVLAYTRPSVGGYLSVGMHL